MIIVANNAMMKQKIRATVTCGAGGKWSPLPEELEECKPVFCNAPPEVIPDNAQWSITYKLFFSHDVSPVGTTFKVQCFPDTEFMVGVSEFEATCHVDGYS